MQYFTIVQTISAHSNLGYEELRISEWGDEDLTEFKGRPQRYFVWSTRGLGCECSSSVWDKPNKRHHCIHSAVYMTWRRQGRPTNELGVGRVYGVDRDGRISYRRGRVLVELSTVSQVNRVEVKNARADSG
jgi:hypothetical protein